jgi:hypothetical protein
MTILQCLIATDARRAPGRPAFQCAMVVVELRVVVSSVGDSVVVLVTLSSATPLVLR